MKMTFLFIASAFLLEFTSVSDSDDSSSGSDIPVYSFEEFEPLLYTDSEKVHVVNFWAMWCAPCVKELPYFKEYEENHPDVQLTLVSLDFPEDIETKLKPFLKEKGFTSDVVLLDAPNANSWIDKIDPNWSGAIPFTIVFNRDKRAFYEGAIDSVSDLENLINTTINKQ